MTHTATAVAMAVTVRRREARLRIEGSPGHGARSFLETKLVRQASAGRRVGQGTILWMMSTSYPPVVRHTVWAQAWNANVAPAPSYSRTPTHRRVATHSVG